MTTSSEKARERSLSTLQPERCRWSSRSAAFMPLHCGNIGVVGSSKASPYRVNAKRHECRAPAAGACSFTRVGACLTESFRLRRSEERRVGKECRGRRGPEQYRRKGRV